MKTSVAYALIGSPGRNRWPSPERHASSYINSDDSGASPGVSPPTGIPRRSIDEGIPTLTDVDAFSGTDIDELVSRTATVKDPQGSQEYRSILQDLQTAAKVEQLTAISDPQEYFHRAAAANLRGS